LALTVPPVPVPVVKQLTDVGVVPFNWRVPDEKPLIESTMPLMKDDAPVGVIATRSENRTPKTITTPWRRTLLGRRGGRVAFDFTMHL
jgi:hypothetical protein